MDQRRRYRNPPIEEALCELHFLPGSDWDLTVPGKLQSEFDGEYSGKPRERKALEVGLDVQEGKPANLRYSEGLARVQLVTEDGKRMVGVGPDVLSVHMLRPYQTSLDPEGGGWREFQRRISEAFDAYWRVAAPVGVCRIGVRYINKIAIPQETARVEEYLLCALPEVDQLPDNVSNFVSRVEYIYQDGVRLVLSQGLISTPPDPNSLLLDLDVIRENTNLVDRDAILKKIRDLRARETDAFEAVITDKARDLFDAG